jgi:hypothetical protein
MSDSQIGLIGVIIVYLIQMFPTFRWYIQHRQWPKSQHVAMTVAMWWFWGMVFFHVGK